MNDIIRKKTATFKKLVLINFLLAAAALSYSQEIEWIRQFGSSGFDYPPGVSVDSSGNVYIAGETSGTLTGQISSGGYDAFIRKYDSAGNEDWTRQFGTSGLDTGVDVSIDSSDNVYITGKTSGTLPGQTSYGNEDVYIRKYDSSGSELWTVQFGSSSYDVPYGLSIDNSNNICVSGYTSGTLPVQISSGSDDAFTRKYDSSGNELWTRQFGTSSLDYARSVSMDNSGNVHVAGNTNGTFPGQTFSDGDDAFIRKYDSSGNEDWTKQFGSSSDDQANSVAADGSGNVYVSGLTFGTLPLQISSGSVDAFIRKYDGSGNEVWTKQFGTLGNDTALSVSMDSTGDVYVVGHTNGTLPGQTSSGLWDVFIRKYDSSGNELWTKQFGTSVTDGGFDLSIDSSGNVYIAGRTEGGTFPGQTSSGGTDAFLVKISQPGYIAASNITGYVKDSQGTGISWVTINITDNTGAITTGTTDAITDSSGYYKFLDILKKSYTLIPKKENWSFSPSISTVYLTEDIEVNFTGTYLLDDTPTKIDIPIGEDGKAVTVTMPEPSKAKLIVEERPEKPENLRGTVNPAKGEAVGIVFKPNKKPEEYINKVFTIKIFNLLGELVDEFTKTPQTAEDTWKRWVPEDIASGTYIVYIKGPGVKVHKKIVILK